MHSPDETVATSWLKCNWNCYYNNNYYGHSGTATCCLLLLGLQEAAWLGHRQSDNHCLQRDMMIPHHHVWNNNVDASLSP
jgi:hypothetical protein